MWEVLLGMSYFINFFLSFFVDEHDIMWNQSYRQHLSLIIWMVLF